MVINNFRRINLSYPKDKKPPYLVELDTFQEFEIFSSNFNSQAYIIYNPNDETYYPFEDQGSDDIKGDLKKL